MSWLVDSGPAFPRGPVLILGLVLTPFLIVMHVGDDYLTCFERAARLLRPTLGEGCQHQARCHGNQVQVGSRPVIPGLFARGSGLVPLGRVPIVHSKRTGWRSLILRFEMQTPGPLMITM